MSPFGPSEDVPRIAIALAVFTVFVGITFFVVPALRARALRTRHQRFFAKLDDVKTALEIEDLRYGWMRTLGTALLTVAVAMGGWIVQRETDARGERQRDALAQSDVFYKQLALLGSDSSTTRNSAVVYLLGYSDPHSEDQRSTGFRKQVLHALINRYAVETDFSVADRLQRGIFDIGPGTFSDLVDVNRESAFQFAEDLGRVVAYELAADELKENERSFVASATGDRHALWNGLRTLATHDLDRINAEYSFVSRVGDGESDPHDPATALRHFFADADQSLPDVFQREFRATLFLTFGKGGSDRKKSDVRIRLVSNDQVKASLARSYARLKQDAFIVRTTSGLIRKFLVHPDRRNASCGPPKNVTPCPLDLRGTILVGLNLYNTDLRQAQLNHAIIYGTFEGVRLDFADLSHADLAALTLKHSSLRDANLYHTFFYAARSDAQSWIRKTGIARQNEARQFFHADLDGANWWDVLVYGDAAEPVSLMPYGIAAKDRAAQHAACDAAASAMRLPHCPWR